MIISGGTALGAAIGGLADLLGHDPAGTDTLAIDGKSARGSRLGATPQKATAKFYDRTTGHGRKETRVLAALTAIDLSVDFPHAAQVAKVVRHPTDTRTGKQSRETVYVITDLTSLQASPERIATISRGHW